MSCWNQIGFDDDCGGLLRLSRSADYEGAGTLPADYDLTGCSGVFVIGASAAEGPLLSITEVENENGSFLILAGREAGIRIKRADIADLPTAEDPNTPWMGFYQWLFTDPDDLTSQLKAGTVVVLP